MQFYIGTNNGLDFYPPPPPLFPDTTRLLVRMQNLKPNPVRNFISIAEKHSNFDFYVLCYKISLEYARNILRKGTCIVF